MARRVTIGKQGFEGIRTGEFFYVDKTGFVRDWWDAGDDVTLVCRPRRFGKTLMLDTVRCFLSTEFAGRGEELFGGLDVWGDACMRTLQGSVPVVCLSLARCKGAVLEDALATMRQVIRVAVREHDYLLESDKINDDDRALLRGVSDNMDFVTATTCIGQLCSMLHRHWGVKPVVLLDEYDTPLQHAWLHGWWEGIVAFVQALFNSTFKTNPHLERALITGITRVAQESIFSDMNNPAVITTTTPQYETAFGFTEEEVEAALCEYSMRDRLEDVRHWYDGFTFGEVRGVYNPWSISSLLRWRRLRPYWASTSSNALVSELVRGADVDVKEDFEVLLAGGLVQQRVNEAVSFRSLHSDSAAVWSLLLSAGYLRVADHDQNWDKLGLALTNYEVCREFDSLVTEWFSGGGRSYNEFVKALLAYDAEEMTACLTDLAMAVMSSFDSGSRPSRRLPELFWHGLVLGLVVELRGRYDVKSNPQSGRGRSDVILSPNDGASASDPAFVLEFKVVDEARGEKSLGDAVRAAHDQIRKKRYVASLEERGIASERIHCFGIAFKGTDVLVG